MTNKVYGILGFSRSTLSTLGGLFLTIVTGVSAIFLPKFKLHPIPGELGGDIGVGMVHE